MGSKYIIDYAEKLKNGELKEIVGRKKEIRRVMHILLRDMKSNPMLLGQTGLGKTSIVVGVAAALAAGDCPPKLKGRTIVGVDIATMMIDCKTQAEYEDQLKDAELDISEIEAADICGKKITAEKARVRITFDEDSAIDFPVKNDASVDEFISMMKRICQKNRK